MAERIMRDDPQGLDPLSLITVERMAAIADLVTPVSQYLFVPGVGQGVQATTLGIEGGVVVTVGDGVFRTVSGNIGPAQLDTGSSFAVGRDYYVYLCDNGTETGVYRISLSTTFPLGFNANNSRKIGGFHFGRCRRVNGNLEPINTAGVAYGTGWEINTYNGIVPRSVWTPKHRPKRPGAPEGMVYAGGGDWVDIYQTGTSGVSAHGVTPLSGTEGHNFLSFSDLALKVGKKLMSYSLWLRAAYGSPQGNDANNLHAWSATTNTGRANTGSVNHAVSSIGCRDCVANLWEWLDEVMASPHSHVINGTTAPVSRTYESWDGGRGGLVNTLGTNHGPVTNSNNGVAAQGAWAWDRETPLGDTTGGNPNNGNVHQLYDRSMTALIAGSGWRYGSHSGCRSLIATHAGLWRVLENCCARFACDSL